MKIAVYTAITNNYEELIRDQNFSNADFFIFSDQEIDDEHWTYLPVTNLFQDPRRNARYHKMLPQLYFRDYDWWVWIDGSIRIKTDISEKIEEGADIIVLRHPDRNCAYQEIRECLRQRLDEQAILERERTKLERDKYPHDNGLAETKVLIRKNNEKVVKFNQYWFLQMAKGTVRDQVNFNYAAWKTKVRIKYLPSIKFLTADFDYIKHRKNRTYF